MKNKTKKIFLLLSIFLASQIYSKEIIIDSDLDDNSSLTNKKRPFKGTRSYSKFSKNIVKDNISGLIWQKKDDGKQRTWKNAKRYCNNLSLDGYNDFRLPSFKELYYLADRKKPLPPFNNKYFTIRSSYYWTNSSFVFDSEYAWIVYFKYGDDHWYDKGNKYYALCVRG